jgi:hypothetical protein
MTQPVNRINWYVNPSMDDSALRSPQPCPRGIACDYKRKNPDGTLVRVWCKFVHPGEEGTGRRIWPEKKLDDGTILPATVRLTGMNTAVGGGWVQRLKERLSWPDWAAKHGLQADTGAMALEIIKIGVSKATVSTLSRVSAPAPAPVTPVPGSQSHRRPQRIDLGGGSTMTAYSNASETFDYPVHEPNNPPMRLNLSEPGRMSLSEYQRRIDAGLTRFNEIPTERCIPESLMRFAENQPCTPLIALKEDEIDTVD